MKQELLKQLKSDYEKLEIKPSADLWSRIEQIDQKDEETSVTSSKKAFQWWKYAAVLVVLFSVGALLYFNQDHPAGINENPIVHTKTVKENTEITLPNPDIHAAGSTKKDNSTGQKKMEEPLTISKMNQLEEMLQKNEVSQIKDEKIILTDYEIKAPVLDRNMGFAPDKISLTESKKTEYINADELLQGREFQKKREENRSDVKRFGTLDMTKIKVKSPNSLKIFGVTVYSDSLESK